MARINEHEIFAKYIGEKVNDCRLAELAQRNGDGYGDYEYILGKRRLDTFPFFPLFLNLYRLKY